VTAESPGLDLPDRELVERAVRPRSVQERHQALTAIYLRYKDSVLEKVSAWMKDADTAEAVVAETFEVAARELSGLGRRGLNPLDDPDRLAAWLGGIARNRCREHWRRLHGEALFPGDDREAERYEAERYEDSASRRRRAQVTRCWRGSRQP
jgi:DNA-directed RNA polymerase specialized sigma24 family protein